MQLSTKNTKGAHILYCTKEMEKYVENALSYYPRYRTRKPYIIYRK